MCELAGGPLAATHLDSPRGACVGLHIPRSLQWGHLARGYLVSLSAPGALRAAPWGALGSRHGVQEGRDVMSG